MAAPGSPADGGGVEDLWRQRWEAVLGELETDVETAERILAEAHAAPAVVPGGTPSAGPAVPTVHQGASASWVPPTGLGPVPASLQVRARALLDRQLDVARRTAESIASGRRHAAAADAMRVRSAAVPVYIDSET
ncbi:hypothetical protein [Cellulomonas marina]|uniref:Uncharacterized protein n=1 Tax=Cellulomonas marina TaxID=988821 RepID=A0A1I0WJC5_9CELL|nr:hypothetical protein [Cellulomonas marina]GIG27670.1 hypothetical protein Cma02nite_02700 [Cellulomonas marina]SFA88338.1 hypothetical protein SAMN05421867_10317 [Cellulomonas marina]